MKMMHAVAMACALLGSGSVVAAEHLSACGTGPAMHGMRERVEAIRRQMDQIEWKTENRSEQGALMKIHVHQMQDGMREIRRRDLSADCRVELLSSIVEQMIRHQDVAREREGD